MVGCNKEKIELPEDETLDHVSKIMKNSEGQTYIEVLGKPFLAIGAQIRLDGLYNRGTDANKPPEGAPLASTIEEVERYIKEAKKMGFTVLQIPIDWSWIELSEDNYDFTKLDEILTLINKYELKMEILWFSTNMTGDVHSFHIPSYIRNDDVTYPKMMSNLDNTYSKSYFSWMYGQVGYMVLDNPNLLARETKVLEKMMDHLYEWNNINGKKYPVIGVQVHNESDGLLRWRHDQRKIKYNDQIVSKERLWEMTLNALNNAGLAIKNSKYKVITRTNMTVSLGIGGFPQAPFASPVDVYELEGIDIVGDDPYVENPMQIESTVNNYTFDNNYPHIAENMGNYESTPQLMLKAYTNGGSYYIYDFVTPYFFTWMNKYYNSSYQMDQGILNPDFSKKPQSDLTKNVIKGIKLGRPLFFEANIKNMKTINSDNQIISKSFNEEIAFDDLTMFAKSESGAIGYIIKVDNKIYIYSTDTVSIKLSANVLPFISLGSFDLNDKFIESSKAYPSGDFLEITPETINIITIK